MTLDRMKRLLCDHLISQRLINPVIFQLSDLPDSSAMPSATPVLVIHVPPAAEDAVRLRPGSFLFLTSLLSLVVEAF